jgi:hypothetical protein
MLNNHPESNENKGQVNSSIKLEILNIETAIKEFEELKEYYKLEIFELIQTLAEYKIYVSNNNGTLISKDIGSTHFTETKKNELVKYFIYSNFGNFIYGLLYTQRKLQLSIDSINEIENLIEKEYLIKFTKFLSEHKNIFPIQAVRTIVQKFSHSIIKDEMDKIYIINSKYFNEIDIWTLFEHIDTYLKTKNNRQLENQITSQIENFRVSLEQITNEQIDRIVFNFDSNPANIQKSNSSLKYIQKNLFLTFTLPGLQKFLEVTAKFINDLPTNLLTDSAVLSQIENLNKNINFYKLISSNNNKSNS